MAFNQIQVPATAASIRTARLVAGSIAARAGITVDGLEDIRLAVDEACSLVLQGAKNLTVTISARDAQLEIIVQGDPATGLPTGPVALLSKRIIEGLVDFVEFGDGTVRLVKGTG